MKAEIVWTAGAERDLVTLFEHVTSATDEFEIALRLLRKPLAEAISLLSENPKLGSSVNGTRGVRRVLLGPKLRYGLYYVEEGHRLMVHALMDVRQNPRLILKRLRHL